MKGDIHGERFAPPHRLQPGSTLGPYELQTIHSEIVPVPDRSRLVHLQFRRFAGCPICSLHLRSIVKRHSELVAAGILEIAVFHSSVEAMRRYETLPFALVADPEKKLYAAFGVEESPRAILNPRAWGAALRGVAAFGAGAPSPGESALGLPAEFLIAPDGRILACKYGEHADDHWSVDELLQVQQGAAADGSSTRLRHDLV